MPVILEILFIVLFTTAILFGYKVRSWAESVFHAKKIQKEKTESSFWRFVRIITFVWTYFLLLNRFSSYVTFVTVVWCMIVFFIDVFRSYRKYKEFHQYKVTMAIGVYMVIVVLVFITVSEYFSF